MSENDAPLGPRLDRAKDRLKTALEKACAGDVDDADTGELIRVEEVLAIANEAAKEALSIKRRLRTARNRAVDDPPQPLSREVQDARGLRWTVFAVRPSAPSSRATLPTPYQSGWLAFDAGQETRRLTPIPEAWELMSDDQLLALCDRAEVARRRPRRE
jgi:hypothetical protein